MHVWFYVTEKLTDPCMTFSSYEVKGYKGSTVTCSSFTLFCLPCSHSIDSVRLKTNNLVLMSNIYDQIIQGSISRYVYVYKQTLYLCMCYCKGCPIKYFGLFLNNL